MSWKISPHVADILKKGADFIGIRREEALVLMNLGLHTRETYALMQTADEMSRKRFNGKGENHLHIGVNIEPCPFDCQFCSLTRRAGIFTHTVTFSETEILTWARDAETQGADALNVMTTGTFSFDRLLDIGRLIKKVVATPLVANTRDVNHREAEALLAAGFEGAYHAVRLGEGRDTPFSPEKRIRTISVFKDVGLKWMNCVEPVGPEHNPEEIVDLMFLARDYGAVYSGIMRRINFPGSPMTKHGMITEQEMARMVAVSRLVMANVPRAHCTHEPHTASLAAGANLFFPEVGSSPRDAKADTGKGRGRDIADCRKMQVEMGWNPDLASNCFGG
ncbi:MAG: radical SAM protein [Desulfococcus multivorans]|jgi:biotin synthase|uniref:radical SAM protein n=1 Tax=Desulfococcus sp. TaxID=2025834 RepID=UPI002A4AAB7B|nr:radical SAM protein [Desulfococcus multivorans]